MKNFLQKYSSFRVGLVSMVLSILILAALVFVYRGPSQLQKNDSLGCLGLRTDFERFAKDFMRIQEYGATSQVKKDLFHRYEKIFNRNKTSQCALGTVPLDTVRKKLIR